MFTPRSSENWPEMRGACLKVQLFLPTNEKQICRQIQPSHRKTTYLAPLIQTEACLACHFKCAFISTEVTQHDCCRAQTLTILYNDAVCNWNQIENRNHPNESFLCDKWKLPQFAFPSVPFSHFLPPFVNFQFWVFTSYHIFPFLPLFSCCTSLILYPIHLTF